MKHFSTYETIDARTDCTKLASLADLSMERIDFKILVELSRQIMLTCHASTRESSSASSSRVQSGLPSLTIADDDLLCLLPHDEIPAVLIVLRSSERRPSRALQTRRLSSEVLIG